MPLWNPVTANSYAAGALWTPDLTLTLMGRDLANFLSPFSWSMTTATLGQGGEELTATVAVCFPDSWDADSVYPCQMRLSLDPQVTCQGTEDPHVKWTDGIEMWLKLGSVTGPRTLISRSGIATGSSTAREVATIDFGQGSVPTGATTVEIWKNYSATNNWSMARAMADGVTSWYGFVII